jgi:phospholipase/carboxylesterase
MPYATHETDAAVTLEPARAAIATVILMHGLGADGYDFVPIVDELRLPEALSVRFIFPHATPRPVTINNGHVMRAWYDIKILGHQRVEDDAGIRGSAQEIEKLIAAQVSQGIATHRIVLAGFSQGGAIALHTGLRHTSKLAGILALSTYLPLRDSLAAEVTDANRAIPILLCHGTHDQMIPLSVASESRDLLISQGFAVEWHEYPMPHSVCPEEIRDMSQWLQRVLAS